MGHHEHEQIYLSLSRKELQGLCKQHGLPANRSNIYLARSLESLFRRTNFSQSPSEEALDELPISEPKPKDQTKFPREADKGFGREYVTRKNSSKAGTYRRIACLKESVGPDKRDSQTACQLENDGRVINQPSDKALDRVASIVSACPASNGTIEDVGCSTSAPGTSSLQHLFAIDVQDAAACPRLGLQCHETCNSNRCEQISELKNNHHSLQCSVAATSRMCTLPLVPSRIKKFGECIPGSGFICSNAITGTALPAFQFLVESEDGINLFVDLSSTPSDWVRSLKDEVCISQESYNRKSLVLCHEIRCLGDANKNLNTLATELIGADSQQKGSGGSTGCANSSLSSVNEFCNSVAHPTNSSTPRSSRITSNMSVELPGRLDEVSQVLSSFCTAYADVKNFTVPDVLSCPGDLEMRPPNSTGNSLMLEYADASPHNGSLSKSSCDSEVNLEANRRQTFDQLENQTLEAGSFCSQNIEEAFLGHMSESASEKCSFALSSERCEISRSFDTCSHKNHGRCDQLSLVSSSKETELLEVADHDMAKSTAHQAPARQKLACLVNDMGFDERELTNDILGQHACANAGNSVPGVPASTSNKELETCISLKEKDNSECPHSTKLSAMTCKRSHASELHEDFQSKRHHTNSENQTGMSMNLRSTKTYLKESNCDPFVLPRRSIRLKSKVLSQHPTP